MEAGCRKNITDILTRAVIFYFAHKTYSCHVEFGVLPWGKRRIDVLALNTKGHYYGVEVKSCCSDYTSDTKWKEYLDYVNQFSFCITEKMWNNEKFRKRITNDTKEYGVGIMVLCSKSGYVRVVQKAKNSKMCPREKTRLVVKMAWRGGECKRNIKRRQRLFIR